MGLSNGSSKARNYTQTINQNQGGGNKKAGLPPQVGKTQWSYIEMQYSAGKCPVTISNYSVMRYPQSCISRPIGHMVNLDYWKYPGIPN